MQQAVKNDNVFLFPKIRFGLSPEQERAIVSRAEKLYNSLKRDYDEIEPDHKELSEYFAPHLYRDSNTQKTRKSKWNKIINNTGRIALRTMSSGMQSGLTSPSRPWMKIGVEDPDLAEFGAVKDWLQFSTMRMLEMFRRTRMYDHSNRLYTNLGWCGTAAQIVFQDFEELLLFKGMMTGRYWIGLNHKGWVDKIVMMRHMTVEQMVKDYGIENVCEQTKNSYNKGDYYITKVVYIAVFPNPYAKSKTDVFGESQFVASNEKPFISCHWIMGEKKPLRTSGFDKFPAQVARWETTDDEAWGIGPGYDAIGDNKATQMKEKEKAKGIQLMNRPPLNVPSQMRHGQYPISGLPGGVTYRPPNTPADSIRANYQVNLPIQYLSQDIQIDEDRIQRAFYADLFLMLSNSDRRQITATEVAERHEEKLLALGPVIEGLSNEFLNPLVERSFEVMMNHGMLPPPPEELQGRPLKIEYVSLLAQAQQQIGIGAIEKFMSFTGFAAQFFPEAVDKVNYDQAIDEVGNMLGVPTRVLVPDDAVQQKRSARAEKQQQMEQMQMGQAALDAAQTLSQTPIGDQSALERSLDVNV